MKVAILYAKSNIEHILINEINKKLADWESEHSNVKIMHVDQKITLVPEIGCPDLLLTLVIVYR